MNPLELFKKSAMTVLQNPILMMPSLISGLLAILIVLVFFSTGSVDVSVDKTTGMVRLEFPSEPGPGNQPAIEDEATEASDTNEMVPPKTLTLLMISFYATLVVHLLGHGITVALCSGLTAKEGAGHIAHSAKTAFKNTLGRLPTILAASLLIGGTVWAGFLLFIFPGIVTFFLLMFAFPAVVDEGHGAVMASRFSFNMVIRRFGDSTTLFFLVFLTALFGVFINVALGVLPVVGQFLGLMVFGFTGAAIGVMILYGYRQLRPPFPGQQTEPAA